ncbi:cytochrome b/b6 domain-containing protein [Streptomyces sp. 4503]|uniref:Cytochrome b/b6 domain-containing protein n=1 Tax=Streptomyces niphimycinicus TaxID=2842201 RepID=A0ABS6CMV2_9ACTN|nr:cytochrome b/b6 domain-containing protein [Streptomyces niphimycinicus]MBU3868180.1 cytochrome b/b6 domain-containing protein [Streptomyces niphimycinicus]
MRSTAGSTTPTGTMKPPERLGRVRRFSTAERMVHRATGWLMLLCLLTAACLYLGPVAQLVGRRHLMAMVHKWSGILLPVPFLLGLLSADFRADLRRLNRFAVYDRQWLRAARRRLKSPQARPAGKFNAGQKLYAGWIAGAVLVMMFTGLLMWFMGLLPFISRTSAIFVHDFLAWAITIVLVGHTRKALDDPEARLGMRTGYVSRSWAELYHSRWLQEGPARDVSGRAGTHSTERPSRHRRMT